MSKRSTAGEGKRGGTRRRSILIGACAVATCLVIGSVLLLRPAGNRHREAATIAPDRSVEMTYVETPEIVTNLDAGPHRVAFAKLQFRVVLARATDAGLLTTSMPRVVDAAESYLRVVRPEELRSGVGAYLLREALLARVATIAAPAEVDGILFEELIVQ